MIELIETVFYNISDHKPNGGINERVKKNHLVTIERARGYITQHFEKDISLTEIAENCYNEPISFQPYMTPPTFGFPAALSNSRRTTFGWFAEITQVI